MDHWVGWWEGYGRATDGQQPLPAVNNQTVAAQVKTTNKNSFRVSWCKQANQKIHKRTTNMKMHLTIKKTNSGVSKSC